MGNITRIAQNSFMVLAARATDLATSLLSSALLARYLGVEDFGNYLFIMAVVITTTSIANMGLPQILLREMAQRPGEIGHLLGSGLILVMLALVPAALIVAVLGAAMQWNLTTFLAVLLTFTSESFVLLAGPFVSAFASCERMQYEAVAATFNRVLMIVVLVAVIWLKLDFIYVFLPLIVSNSLRFLTTHCLSLHIGFVPKFRNWRHETKFLAKEALPLGVSFIFTQLLLYTNVFILKFLGDPQEIALFQAPFGIVTKFQVLPTVLIVSLAPLMSRLAITDLTYTSLERFYTSVLKYLLSACIPVSVTAMLLSPWIVTALFGPEFAPSSASLRVVIWIIGLSALNIFSDKALTVIGKQNLLAWSSGIAFFFNAVLASILVGSHGYFGSSIAALCSFGILFFLNWYFLSRYLKNLSLSFMVKPLIALGVVFAAIHTFRDMNLVFLILISASLYAGLLHALHAFNRLEFNLFRGILRESK